MNGGLSMPSITTSSWLSASWPWPPIIPGKIPWLRMFPTFVIHGGYGELRSGARCSNMRSRQARLSMIRSPLGLTAPYGP